MNRPRIYLIRLLAMLLFFMQQTAFAGGNLQTCYDHWKALEKSSREQKDTITSDYASKAANAISEAITDKTGQAPESNTDLYKRMVNKWPAAIEKDIPQDCRVIEGVGDFSDSAFMRKVRKEINEALSKNDFDKAALKARIFADKGDAESQLVLGKVYQRGGGNIQQDLAEAVKWFRKAANQGNAKAQLQLGLATVKGLGVTQDASEGVKWIRKAADGGDSEAQIFMSQAYLNGIGVTKDATESTNWLMKASEKGNYNAQAMLGERYANGIGVNRDLMMAHMWLDIASKDVIVILLPQQNANIPALRDRVGKLLKPDELNRAEKWAKECGSRRYKNCVKMDADIAAKQDSAAQKEALFKKFAAFLEGPWGRSTTSGEAVAAETIRGSKIEFGRKSCPGNGIGSPAEMEENEIWFEIQPNGELFERMGKWGGGGGEHHAVLRYNGMQSPDAAEFNVTIDGSDMGKLTITKQNDNQIMTKRVFGIVFEKTYIRCRKK